MRQHAESWGGLPGGTDNAASAVRTRRKFVLRKKRNQTAIYTKIVRAHQSRLFLPSDWQESRAYFDYHHTAAATFDKVVPQELAESTTVMAVLAFALADLRQTLPR
jgi:hypothetical protein